MTIFLMLPKSANFYDGDIEHEKFKKVTTMKLKLMPIFAYAIALTVAAAPLAVKAEPTAPLSGQVASQAKGMNQIAGVEITEEQQAQMEEVRRETQTQIEAILTPEQREKFQTAKESGQGPQAAFANLNLSEDQKARMREVMQSARSRAETILTPEQRQQIQQNLQQRQQGIQQGEQGK